MRVDIALIILLESTALFGQQTVTGTVRDGVTKAPLPYATIRSVGQLSGTVADVHGYFEFKTPAGSDSLMVSYVGYTDTVLAIESIVSGQDVTLAPWVNELTGVVVLPKKPEHYLRLAVRNYAKSLAAEPFRTRAYYHNFGTVADRHDVREEEVWAVFDIYYPNYADRVQVNQNQLLLHRSRSKEVDIDMAFIEEAIEKKAAKQDTLSSVTARRDEEEESVRAALMGGGPEAELKRAQWIVTKAFLDTTMLDEFKYWFAEPTIFNNRQLMTIAFESKGRVNVISRFAGKIFLDEESFAIVRVEYVEEITIPLALKPVVRMVAGFQVNGVQEDVVVQNQYFRGKWYPKEIWADFSFKASKSHFFRKDDRLSATEHKLLSVERVWLDDVSQIPEHHRYDPKKPMADQVYNPHSIQWKDIQTIGR